MNSSLNTAISNQPDIRAEVLVVETGYHHLMNGEKLFYTNGGFKRAFRKDIETIHNAHQNKFKVESEVIEVNREGLYDSFPELLFHKSKRPKHFKTAKEFKEEHLFNQEIEENSRRFFWVFDHFLTEMKSIIYMHEIGKNHTKTKNTYKTLQEFWNIPKSFADTTIIALCKLMPYAKEIAMKINWIEQTFQLILKDEISIKKKLKTFNHPFENENKPLGNFYLGNDAYLGSSLWFSKYVIEIAIGPLGKKAIQKYTDNGDGRKVLDFLVAAFVPADLEVKYEYIPHPDIKLNLDINDKSILGLTSVL